MAGDVGEKRTGSGTVGGRKEDFGAVDVTLRMLGKEACAAPGWSVAGAPAGARCNTACEKTLHGILKAATTETLARRRRAPLSCVVDPRVPARPEEDTIMQSTYGSNPVRFAL